jgi:hypothetical protein
LDHLHLDRENIFENRNVGITKSQSIQVGKSLQYFNVDEISRGKINERNRCCVAFLLICNLKLDLFVSPIFETQFFNAALNVSRPMTVTIDFFEKDSPFG